MHLPSRNPYGLNNFLYRWHQDHPPRLGFKAKSVKAAMAWQKAFRLALREAMGPMPERGALTIRAHRVQQRRGYRLERFYLAASPWHEVPVNLLIPDGAVGAPVILALHGHGPGKSATMGGEPGHRAYAMAYLRRGFVVVTPDFYPFGEREQKDHPGAGLNLLRDSKRHPEINPYSIQDHVCNASLVPALLYGFTPLALNVADVMRVLDYLETRPEADVGRAGCMGMSYGGITSMYAAVLDKRIRRTVLSCSFGAFAGHGLYLDELCGVQAVPGIMRLGDMAEVAGCIAPRPLLLEVATNDSFFPWEYTASEIQRLKKIYAAFNASSRLAVDIFSDGHRFYGDHALGWFDGGDWRDPEAAHTPTNGRTAGSCVSRAAGGKGHGDTKGAREKGGK
jgi:dienelactone hydrolase